jgi:hypothetical protein
VAKTMEPINYQSDHDLLITLHSEVKGLRKDISEMNDGLSKSVEDHETRIRRLESWGGIAIGGLYVLNVVLGYWLAFKK